mmetsp:Transcript_3559/g.6741  ORF Transcript_3559/g.6741 Transcript_3559/m.6741 type:complete len:313 (+) Transcript_3559:19-957(+)
MCDRSEHSFSVLSCATFERETEYSVISLSAGGESGIDDGYATFDRETDYSVISMSGDENIDDGTSAPIAFVGNSCGECENYGSLNENFEMMSEAGGDNWEILSETSSLQLDRSWHDVARDQDDSKVGGEKDVVAGDDKHKKKMQQNNRLDDDQRKQRRAQEDQKIGEDGNSRNTLHFSPSFAQVVIDAEKIQNSSLGRRNTHLQTRTYRVPAGLHLIRPASTNRTRMQRAYINGTSYQRLLWNRKPKRSSPKYRLQPIDEFDFDSDNSRSEAEFEPPRCAALHLSGRLGRRASHSTDSDSYCSDSDDDNRSR